MFSKGLIFIFFYMIFIFAGAVEIVDMAGRKADVPAPNEIKRVYTSSAAMNYLIYALAPEKLCAYNRGFRPEDMKYILPEARKKPVLGGWMGQGGKITNSEEVLKVGPQLVFASLDGRRAIGKKIERTLRGLNIPLVYVKINDLVDLPESILFLGNILDKKDRAKKLSNLASGLLKKIKQLPKGDKKLSRIYYTYSPDGLHTCVGDSPVNDSLRLVGGINVIDQASGKKSAKWRVKVSMEKILLSDPDIILIGSDMFYKNVFINPKWRALRAVREGRCYLIPSSPMSWLDRPASFMRLVGVLWLAHLIDPKAVPEKELTLDVKNFYKVFLQYQISEEDAYKLLGKKGGK
jgi:iron complex transport system substrate-binding protein